MVFCVFWDTFDVDGFEPTAKTSEAPRVLLRNLDRNETRGTECLQINLTSETHEPQWSLIIINRQEKLFNETRAEFLK